MPRQFDLFETAPKRFSLILQSDLLSVSDTCVVMPAYDPAIYTLRFHGLTRKILLEERPLILAPHLMTTLQLPDLGKYCGNLEDQRDEIIRAIDTLISGV